MTRGKSTDWYPYAFEMAPRWRFTIERFDGDKGFQRPQSERFIEKEARAFDPRRFEPLICVRVEVSVKPDDWLLSIIDGQHRFGMNEHVGHELLPALVHRELLGYEDRAMLFNELNLRRRQLNLRDSMRARAEGKEEHMLGLLALLARRGFFLDGHKPSGETNGCRSLTARGALDRNYKYDAAALDQALTAMRGWDDMITRRGQSAVIDALCLIARHAEFDVDRMRGVLHEVGPQRLVTEALEIAALGRGRLSKEVVGVALLRHYNKGLRSRRVSLDGDGDGDV